MLARVSDIPLSINFDDIKYHRYDLKVLKRQRASLMSSQPITRGVDKPAEMMHVHIISTLQVPLWHMQMRLDETT
jgi:hypothetical protein